MVAYFNQMKASLPALVREVLALFVDDFALVGTKTFERFLEHAVLRQRSCCELLPLPTKSTLQHGASQHVALVN